MRASELMIGDLVMYQCNPLKVQHIYNDGYDDIVAEITKESIDENGLFEEVEYVRLDYCSPIPLTPEILEKNGFKHHGEFVWLPKEQPRLDEGLMGIGIDGECGTGFCIMPEGILTYFCKYVHKVQHLLRLCELDELADNFKI